MEESARLRSDLTANRQPLTASASTSIRNRSHHIARDFLVLRELHRVSRATLAHGAHGGRVLEHLSERHFCSDDFARNRIFHSGDLTAATIQVTDDVTVVILWRHHLYLHDRLEDDGFGIRHRVLERHRTCDLECHLVRVDVVVRAVEQGHLDVYDRVACKHTVSGGFANAFLDGRDVFLRNRTANDRVDELEALPWLGRLELNPHVTILAATTGLTDEFAF